MLEMRNQKRHKKGGLVSPFKLSTDFCRAIKCILQKVVPKTAKKFTISTSKVLQYRTCSRFHSIVHGV